MDHTFIEDHGLIDLYHRGQLPPEQEIEFEEHFVGCAECQERLEMARGFQRGLKTTVAEDVVRTSLLAWAMKRRGLAVLALLLAAVLPAVGFLAGSRDARQSIEARWRRLYEGERQNATGLRQRLEESERRRNEERRELEDRLAQAETPTAAAPLVNTPVFLLTAVRSEPGEPAAVIDLSTSRYFSLAVDAGDDPRIQSYRVTIADSRGARVFREAGLKANPLEAVLVTFPGEYFKPGEYRLAVEGVKPDGTVSHLGAHSFRVVP
jgi:hypothetical protein